MKHISMLRFHVMIYPSNSELIDQAIHSRVVPSANKSSHRHIIGRHKEGILNFLSL